MHMPYLGTSMNHLKHLSGSWQAHWADLPRLLYTEDLSKVYFHSFKATISNVQSQKHKFNCWLFSKLIMWTLKEQISTDVISSSLLPSFSLCFSLPLPFLFLPLLLKRRGMNSYLFQKREKLYKEKVKLAVKGMSNLSGLILESD